MVGTPRKNWPDRRPPPPVPGAALTLCARCGEPVASDEHDDGEPARHLVCEPGARRALALRIEASRSIQRVIAALATVPPVRARLGEAIAALPDACDVPDALAFLARARDVVDCTPDLTPQQRRVAISFLAATERKLGA